MHESSDQTMAKVVGQISPMEPQSEQAWRLPHLDVLRGMAATWVLLFHLVYLTTPNMVPPGVLDKLVKSGGMGVTLFFVVSAFSLCLSSDRHHNEERWIFYLRRFFRIAPLFYVILVVTLLRDKLDFGLNHGYPEIVASVLFLFNFAADWQGGIVWASWTIGIEMVFYVLFPYVWRRGLGFLEAFYRTVLLCTVSVVAFSLISYFDGGEKYWQWSFFRHLPSFLLGILVYVVWKSIRDNNYGAPHRVLGRAIFGAALFLGVALVYSTRQFPMMPALYWQALVFSLLVLGATLGAAREFFSIPVLRWVGRNSYSIYLLHPLTIVALQPAYKVITLRVEAGPLAFLLCAAMTLGCVLGASEICWRYIEKPGIDAGSRLIGRLRILRSNLREPSDTRESVELQNG